MVPGPTPVEMMPEPHGSAETYNTIRQPVSCPLGLISQNKL